MERVRKTLLVSVVLALVGAVPAQAGVFNVTTSADVAGSCPGPTCSLRAAINAANASPDDDTINLPPGYGVKLASSLPPFTNSNVTIVGPACIFAPGPCQGQAGVDGGGSFAIFDFEASGKSLSVQRLMLTRGKIAAGSSGNQGGAAIRTGPGTSLTVFASVFTDNAVTATGGYANGGGAIYNNGTTLTITWSQFAGNSVGQTGGLSNDGGGAVYNNGTDVSITGSDFAPTSWFGGVPGNTVSVTAANGNDGGGAVYQNGGKLTVTGSVFDGNSAAVTTTGSAGNSGGAAVYNDGTTLTVTGSRITGNSLALTASGSSNVDNGGAGIYQNGGDVSIAGSDISDNAATMTGNIGSNSGGGGLFNNGSNLTIDSSSITGNQESAPSGSTSGGGGIYHNGGTATLTNSTISGNSASPPAGGSNNGGGGLYHNGVAAGSQFQSVTFAGNSTTAAGGNVFNDTGATLPTKDTIVAGGSASLGGANCAGLNPLGSQGNNLDSADGCGFHAAGDKVNADPRLSPLVRGYHVLFAGSAALDAGAGCPATDQRGVSRPQGAACDIGAVEDQLSTAATGDALAITDHSALLTGMLSPVDTSALARFDYGTTTAYGAATPVVDGGPGYGHPIDTAVWPPPGTSVTGLPPHTTYHYRLEVTNAAGTAFGQDRTFTTLFADPRVAGFAVRPNRFRRARGATAISQVLGLVRRIPRGSAFRFSLNEAALVRIRIYRLLPGRRLRGRCVAPSRRLLRGRRCTRLLFQGTLTRRRLHAGANQVRFTGRIGRRPLAAGFYRATIVATVNGAANRNSPTRSADLRILPG